MTKKPKVTPYQLDLWSANMGYLYNALEGEIIRQLIKRLQNGHTDIQDWQAQALKDLRLFNSDVTKLLAEVTGIAEGEVTRMFVNSGEQMVKDIDNVMPQKARPIPTDLDQTMRGLANQRWLDIDNFVNQTLISTNYKRGIAAKEYTRVLNRTQALFNTGSLTLDQAMQRAITELAHKGIKSTFKDKGGHTWSMERYTRTVLKSTFMNTYDAVRKERMEEYGCHHVVVTSHMGARRQCSLIQGQVVDLRHKSEIPAGSEYKSIYDPSWGAHYGTAGGHRGVNCKHMHIPFIPGVNTNNQPQFDPTENAKVAQLSAKQHELERRVIKLKKEKMIAEAFDNKADAQKAQRKITATQRAIQNIVNSNEYLGRNYKREKVYTPLPNLVKEYRENAIIKHRKMDNKGFLRHVRGTDEYKEYLAKGTRAGGAPGILTINQERLDKLVQQLVPDKAFETNTKGIINFHEIIGEYVDQNTGEMIPTMKGTLHVGKKGYHIVPTHPNAGG